MTTTVAETDLEQAAVPETGRVQLALNVSDMDEAIAFYTKLFSVGPAKMRPGYANFAVDKLPFVIWPAMGDHIRHALEHNR